MRSDQVRFILLIFIFSRLLVFIGIILGNNFETSSNLIGAKLLHANISINNEIFSKLKRTLELGDAGWYLGIAEKGYKKETFSTKTQANWAFFPLLPIFIYTCKHFASNYLIYVLIGTNLFFFLSLIYLWKLLEQLEFDEESCKRAVTFCAFFPSSYLFSAPMTEPLFLLLSICSFYALYLNRLLLSGTIFALATATRITGLILLPVYYLAILQRKSYKSPTGIVAIIIAPLGILLFMAHLNSVCGNPLAFYDIQKTWGRGEANILAEISKIFTSPALLVVDWNPLLLNFLALLFALVSACLFFFRGQMIFAWYLLFPIFAIIYSGSLLSATRILGALFPFYISLAEIGRNQLTEKIVLIFSGALLFIMSCLYGASMTIALT